MAHRRSNLKIEWAHDIPAGVVEMAQRRTADMLKHYGNNIRSMPIETLLASCYLQGVEDCFKYHERQNETVGGKDALRVEMASRLLGVGYLPCGLPPDA